MAEMRYSSGAVSVYVTVFVTALAAKFNIFTIIVTVAYPMPTLVACRYRVVLFAPFFPRPDRSYHPNHIFILGGWRASRIWMNVKNIAGDSRSA